MLSRSEAVVETAVETVVEPMVEALVEAVVEMMVEPMVEALVETVVETMVETEVETFVQQPPVVLRGLGQCLTVVPLDDAEESLQTVYASPPECLALFHDVCLISSSFSLRHPTAPRRVLLAGGGR